MNYKIIILLFLLCCLFPITNEYFKKRQLFLVKLRRGNNNYLYNLYDNTHNYNSYCNFKDDFLKISPNKYLKFNKFKNKINNHITLNNNLIKRNNKTVICERKYFYKIKYFISNIENEYLTDGFYIFLYVLFLKEKLNYNKNRINRILNNNNLNVTVTNIEGNLFIKMRDIIFTKEICYSEKIAGISNDFLKNKTNTNNYLLKDIPKVLEFKIKNNKFKLFNIENKYFKHKNSKINNDYLNSQDFKRRLFINTVNSVNDIYMDKTLNNILSFSEFEKTLINSKNNFEQKYNNILDCDKLDDNLNIKDSYCDSNRGFNSGKSYTDDMFKCGNNRIIINLNMEKTIDLNKLHYELCPNVINEKVVGKMDFFNENCSNTSNLKKFSKLPFNYWLFNN